MASIYKAQTGETFTVTDEKPIGGFSQFGIVYAATDAQGKPYVVKVSRNPDYNPRFIAEYDTLKAVAEATSAKHNGEVYTPHPVYLVRAEGDDKQAIAMPRYTATLAKELGDTYRGGKGLDAEFLFLHGATTYLKVLDAIHDKKQTCADRKQDDFFLSEDKGRVITIDWNVLQPYSDDARITEVKVTARRWIELTVQRVATEGDLASAFDDSQWTRADYSGAGGGQGAISVGLRWILVTALANQDANHFEVLKEQLTHWWTCLYNNTTPNKAILRVTHDGVYNAIVADFDVRIGIEGATVEKRDEALKLAASYSPSLTKNIVNAVEAARQKLLEGDAERAHKLLSEVSPTTAEETAVRERWLAGVAIAQGIDRNQRSAQRPKLITILITLSRFWKNDVVKSLEEARANLDELTKATSGVETQLKALRDELDVRLTYLNALAESDATKRSGALKHLKETGAAALALLPDLVDELNKHLSGGDGVSSDVDKYVKPVETAYSTLCRVLSGLTDWDDTRIVAALREFDRSFDAVRTRVLLHAPVGYIAFKEKVSGYLSVRDFIESLRFERETAVAGETLKARLPQELIAFGAKSPAVRQPLFNRYSELQQRAKGVVDKELADLKTKIEEQAKAATSKLETQLSNAKQFQDSFQSLMKQKEDKPAPKPAAWMTFVPLGVAALALLVGVVGMLTGLNGSTALTTFTTGLTETALAIPPEQQTQIAQGQTAVAEAAAANAAATQAAFVTETHVMGITMTATVATFTPTPTSTPTPTDTPTITPTPPIVPVAIASETSPFFTGPDGTLYAVAGEAQTLTFRVVSADGQSALPENQSLKFNTNQFDGTVPVIDGVATVLYTPVSDGSGENLLTVSVVDGQQISAQPVQIAVKVVTRTGDIAVDATSAAWLDTGMLTTNAESEVDKLQTIRFSGGTENYPVEMKYEILYAPLGRFPKLILSGQEVLPDQAGLMFMNADQSLQIQAMEAGLYRLSFTDPLAKREIGHVVFAAGYSYVGLPLPAGLNRASYAAFILPNNGRVTFFSDRRYLDCKGADYKALVMQPRQAGTDVPVLLAGYVKPGTPNANRILTLTAESIGGAATAIEFAPPQSNAGCMGYLNDTATVGPMTIDGVPTLDVYDGERTKQAGAGTAQFVYFEAVAPAGLFNDQESDSSGTSPTVTPAQRDPTATPNVGGDGTGQGGGG